MRVGQLGRPGNNQQSLSTVRRPKSNRHKPAHSLTRHMFARTRMRAYDGPGCSGRYIGRPKCERMIAVRPPARTSPAYCSVLAMNAPKCVRAHTHVCARMLQ
jgi:hypothetical protein